MLLMILTRTRKTVTRIVILPGTLSGGTRKLGKDLINYFLKKRWKLRKEFINFVETLFHLKNQEKAGKDKINFSGTIFHLIQDTMTNMPAGK